MNNVRGPDGAFANMRRYVYFFALNTALIVLITGIIMYQPVSAKTLPGPD
ncbi:MAG: hypothetical protein RI985_2201, partial [Chloroflexota bacterium]